MPKPSNFEIMEKAREMGLKLSEDGKSWVPIDELVVQLPPPRHPAYIPGTTRKILTSIIFWMIICFLFAALAGMFARKLVGATLEVFCLFFVLLFSGGGSG